MNRQDAAPGSGFLYLGLAVDFASPFRHSSAAGCPILAGLVYARVGLLLLFASSSPITPTSSSSSRLRFEVFGCTL